MVSRSSKSQEEFRSLFVEVERFDSAVMAHVNTEVWQPRSHTPETPIFDFGSEASITGHIYYPPEVEGWRYDLHVYGDSLRDQASEVLGDTPLRNTDGEPRLVRRGGLKVPAFDSNHSLGFVNKIRGEEGYAATVWVPRSVAADMLGELRSDRPSFLSIHERKVDRSRFVVGVTISSSRPE